MTFQIPSLIFFRQQICRRSKSQDQKPALVFSQEIPLKEKKRTSGETERQRKDETEQDQQPHQTPGHGLPGTEPYNNKEENREEQGTEEGDHEKDDGPGQAQIESQHKEDNCI